MAATVAPLGSGAMAQLYAGLLQQIGAAPLLLQRPQTVPTSTALSLELLDGSLLQQSLPLQPSDSPVDVDAILVFTKAQDTVAAVTPILQWLPQTTPIVLLHNGMGPQQQLACAYPQHNLWAGSVSDGAERLAQWLTAQRGIGQRTVGALNQATPLPPCLAALNFNQTTQIESVLWQKLTANAVINPLCGRDNVVNGALLAQSYQSEIRSLCGELVLLGEQLGMVETLDQCHQRILTIATATAANRCSTVQDINANRPTELAAITGYVLQQAAQFGLKLHQHQRLYQHWLAQVEPQGAN